MHSRLSQCPTYVDTPLLLAPPVADLWSNSFVLFLDPYHKRMFQLHLGTRSPEPQGIDTAFLQSPLHAAYDQTSQMLYWYEQDDHVIKTAPL